MDKNNPYKKLMEYYLDLKWEKYILATDISCDSYSLSLQYCRYASHFQVNIIFFCVLLNMFYICEFLCQLIHRFLWLHFICIGIHESNKSYKHALIHEEIHKDVQELFLCQSFALHFDLSNLFVNNLTKKFTNVKQAL